jgi:hypothetical protein
MSSHVVFRYSTEARAVDTAANAAIDLINKFVEQAEYHRLHKPNQDEENATEEGVVDDVETSSVNPWENPEVIMTQLNAARNTLLLAWKNLEDTISSDEAGANPPCQPEQKVPSTPFDESEEVDSTAVEMTDNERKMRTAFVDMITDSFADVLDDLRQQEGDNIDIEILIDCLQSGFDIMMTSPEEREYFLQSGSSDHDYDDIMVDDDDDNQSNISKNNDNMTLTPHEIRRRQLGFNVEISPA